MIPAHRDEENDVTHAAGPPSPRHRRHRRLLAGALPEKRADGDQGCPNPCRRDDGPVDCKTQRVRRRLAEELGCCGCTKLETPCLVTEDTSLCCRRHPDKPTCCPEPKADPAPAACSVDPVEQIINEGLMAAKKPCSRRRSSCGASSSRPRGPSGRQRRARPSTANQSGYQPDFFDDQADMSNWQQHRDLERAEESRRRPSTPPSRPKCLAFQPYVDNESDSPFRRPATPGAVQRTPPQDENEGRNMQLELERLDEQRARLMECMQRECKILELVREYKQLQREAAALQQPRCDDRERLQRRIDEEKRKLAECQRRSQGPDGRCATPTGTYEIPADMLPSPMTPPTCYRGSACAAASTPQPPPRQRRKLCYQPPSPDTEDECDAPPPPRRRLLKYIPPSPSDSSSDCGESANACGRPAGSPRCPSPDPPASSLQDSFMYYYRAFRNGAAPVTADVPQLTSSTWSTGH